MTHFYKIPLFALLLAACGPSAHHADGADTAKTDSAMVTPMSAPQTDLSDFTTDADGYICIFDGKTFKGWRGYNAAGMPTCWVVEDGAIKVNASDSHEGEQQSRGDIIFTRKFRNFELSLKWRVARGANSGIFYLAQEVAGESIAASAPECQVLDNDNHPDALLGNGGNRLAGSLYDLLAATPQNARPQGQWNQVVIRVDKGHVSHMQNGVTVVDYHLWTPQWTDMLQHSKFSEREWPAAFNLLSHCGGDERDGYIGLQDHGDEVWFKDIKIKILDQT